MTGQNTLEIRLVEKSHGADLNHWIFAPIRRHAIDRWTGRPFLMLDTEQAVNLRNELTDFINARLEGKQR